MTTRQVADLRTNFSVSGVEDVSKAANKVAESTKRAFDTAATAAGKSGDKVAAAGKRSNEAALRLAQSQARQRLDSRKKGGDPAARYLLQRSIQEQKKAAEDARASVASEAAKTVAQAEAAHKSAVQGAVKKANTAELNGTSSEVARAQLQAFIAVQDQELDRVRTTTAELVKQSRAQDEATESAIRAASSIKETEERMSRLKAAVKGVFAGFAAEVSRSVRGVKSLAHAVGSVAKGMAHVATSAVKAGLSMTVGNAWRGAVGILHKVRDALAGIIHKLEDVARKAAKAALILYGLKSAGESKLVKDSAQKGVEHSDDVIKSTQDMNLYGVKHYSLGLHDSLGQAMPQEYRAQDITSAAKGLGLDPGATSNAFKTLSDTMREAIKGYDANTKQFTNEQGQLLGKLTSLMPSMIENRDVTPERVMKDVASRFVYMNAAQQQAIIDKLFGGNPDAARILQTIGRTSGDVSSYGRERAVTLGTFLSREDLVMFQVFKRDVATLKDAWEGVYNAIARRVVPVLDVLAQRATNFLVNYRGLIADVVGSQFRRLVQNAQDLAFIVEREFHVIEHLTGAAQGYLRSGYDWILHGYQAYLTYVKPMFPTVYGWFVRLKAGAESFRQAFVAAWKIPLSNPLDNLKGKKNDSASFIPDIVKKEIDPLGEKTRALATAHKELSSAWKDGGSGVTHYRWLIPATQMIKLLGLGVKNLTYLTLDLYHAFQGQGADHFPWVDGFVRKVKSAGKAIWGVAKDAWAALNGDAAAVSGGDKFFHYLAEKRNAIVAYVKQSVIDVLSVFENGVTDDPIATWAGRMANDIGWLVTQVPIWFKAVVDAIKGAKDWVVGAYGELMTVLGNGAGDRGQSMRWPWLTSLLEGVDAVVDRVTQLAGLFKTTYDAAATILNPILGLFGTDLSKTLLFLSFVRLLAMFTGLGTVLGTVMEFFAGGALAAALTPVGLIIAGMAASILMIGQALKMMRYNKEMDSQTARMGGQDHVGEYIDRQAQMQPGADTSRAARGMSALSAPADKPDWLKTFENDKKSENNAGNLAPVNIYLTPDTMVSASVNADQYNDIQSQAAFRTSPPPSWNR